MEDDLFEEELFRDIDEIIERNKLSQNEDIEALKEKISSLITHWEEDLLKFENKLEKIKRLERMLESSESKEPYRSTKREKGAITPQRAYEIPILEILYKSGGRARISEVHKKIEEKMKDIFTEKDKESLQSGTIRWEKNVDWCRYELVQKGLLRNDSPNGIWELSEEGYKFIEEKLKNGR
ncbi:MAG: winged helix-turn-helix domain-containing protein [Dictyoglomaceae bacterium]|nr:winged helix-turn-helix domain-containing protein [Dictyoglomaceae bacterium]